MGDYCPVCGECNRRGAHTYWCPDEPDRDPRVIAAPSRPTAPVVARGRWLAMSEQAEWDAPIHNHVPGCRAVWFDDAGAYRGTRASDPENCQTCRDEQAASKGGER